MNSLRPHLLFFVLFAFLGTLASAQTVVSPQVNPDGSVTFRLKAPNADVVELELDTIADTVKKPMAQQDGIWTVTTPALTPDVYSYQFAVDGIEIIDPNVHWFVPNHFGQGGVFLVPGNPAQPWEERDVPHGVVHLHFYTSKIVGDRRDYYVYTPPGFDPKKHTKYPVLYLLHGYSDMADAWTVMGRANIILDNLIADGKAKPMIVVMPTGYGAPEILANGWHLDDTELWMKNIRRFSDTLLDEVIPQVEREYPVRKERDSRAISGLSMGGAETLYVGLTHPSQFAYVAPLSAADFNNPDLFLPSFDVKAAQKLKLLWIACGKEDHLITANRDFEKWLTSKDVKFTAVEVDGAAHTWPLWRRNLVAVAPLLFR